MISYYFFQRKHRAELEASMTSGSEQAQITTFVNAAKPFSSTDPRQKLISDKVVNYVAAGLVPIVHVDYKEFHEMMHAAEPRFKVPSRGHVTDVLLPNKYKKLQDVLMEHLKQAENVCLTADIWSSRQMHGYIGMTCHYIHDWTLKSALLACSHFPGRHTGENIRQQYEEIVACYDITSKVLTIVTDNAANMTKAFSLPEFNIQPTAEDLEICEAQSDTAEASTSEEPESDIEDEDQESDKCFINREGCFAHTLQLVVKDGFQAAGALKKVLAKASSIVNHVRKSCIATEILSGELRLQACNLTRWNSQIKMVRSILRIPEAKLQEVQKVQHLTQYERKLLQEVVTIFEPFEEATEAVQYENSVSASLIIPTVLGLKQALEDMSATYNGKMVQTLQASLEKRLLPYLQRDVYVTATCLDPRFKLCWCSDTEFNQRKAKLVEKARSLQKLQTDLHEEDSAPAPEPQPKRFKMWSSIPKSRNSSMSMSKEALPSAVQQEINKYLSEDCVSDSTNVLEFWKAHKDIFPLLSMLAKKYFCVQASSAPCERRFNIAGKILRAERCSMSHRVFEQLMFIKCNRKTLQLTQE